MGPTLFALTIHDAILEAVEEAEADGGTRSFACSTSDGEALGATRKP